MFLYHAVFPNGKKYIGITNDITKRKRSHKNNANSEKYKHLKISRAIVKYGFETIQWVIADGYEDRNKLLQLEIDEIAKYQTTNDIFGYNTTEGGEGSLGFRPSAETIEKLKLRRHTHKWKKEHAKRMTGRDNPFYGKHHSEEFKKQKSISLKGNKNVMTKITDDQVKDIREKYNSGVYTQKELAELFDIGHSQIERIVHYKSRV